MHLLTSLLLLIVIARLLGELSVRLKQPAIVGEMLSGVVLGPAVLNVVKPGPALAGISELSVFLIVLSSGLEMNFRDVTSAFRGRGLLIGILGFIIPFFSGILLGIAYELDVMRTVFLGLAVSITALPVAIRILDSFNLLKSDIAKYSIGAAIFSDIAALLALGVILNLPNERSFGAVAHSVLYTGGKLVLLGIFILGVNFFLHRIKFSGMRIERIPERLVDLFGSEALFGIVIVFVLIFGSISQTLGFHFVIGAFFGAVLIDKDFFFASRYSELEKTIGSVTDGFLAPVFFAYLGIEFDIASMKSAEFVIVLLVVSVLSKVLAGWMGGRLAHLSKPEALGTGIILNGRGVMGLVIASIALDRGFIGRPLFSTLVLMSIFTTVLAPLLFKRLVRLNPTSSSVSQNGN